MEVSKAIKDAIDAATFGEGNMLQPRNILKREPAGDILESADLDYKDFPYTLPTNPAAYAKVIIYTYNIYDIVHHHIH